MHQKIKLIWDFKGDEALEIAKHHCVHLKEFSETASLQYDEIGQKQLHEMHVIAYIVVAEEDMKTYRDALKPHRGELA